MKKANKSFYTPKNKYVRDFVRQTAHGGGVIARNRKFVSSSFDKIVEILKKYYGKDLEKSVLFKKHFDKMKKIKKHYETFRKTFY